MSSTKDRLYALARRLSIGRVLRYLDLWARDEALGFEGIFFSEHHFGGSFGASPNLLIAAMASRTRTLRLGVMGVVLPYLYGAFSVNADFNVMFH